MSVDDTEEDGTWGAVEVGFYHEDMVDERPHSHDDELLDAFGEGSHTPIIVDPVDGLPRPADEWVAPAPKLTVESLVCIEDDSSYVEVFLEEASWKEAVSRALHKQPDGLKEILASRRSAYEKDGTPRERRSFAPDKVIERFGILVVPQVKGYVMVRPVRPQCDYLVRQIVDAGDVDAGGVEVRPMYTYCKAFKSVSGAYLSLMDRAVYACEHRSPMDTVSVEAITSRIKKKIREGQEREMIPAFKAPNPKGNRFEGEFGEEPVRFSGRCDPAMAPGRDWSVVVGPPSRYDGSEEHVLFCGAGFDRTDFVGKRQDLGFHCFILWPSDYAPESASDEEVDRFAEHWPTHAKFPFLKASLERTPEFLSNQALRGERVYVCALDRRDAWFAASLLLRILHQANPDLPVALRKEQAHYLKRTEKHVGQEART